LQDLEIDGKKKCVVVFTGPTFLRELFKPAAYERNYAERPTASCRNRLYCTKLHPKEVKKVLK